MSPDAAVAREALNIAEGHLQVKDTRKRVHTVVTGEVRLIQ